MTVIRIGKKNGKIVSVECDGHTGYGVEGEDVVCAALSSIVQTARSEEHTSELQSH